MQFGSSVRFASAVLLRYISLSNSVNADIDGGRDLTYMLISEAIALARQNGKLVPARPVVPWAGEPRAFLMCKPLAEIISDGRASPDEKERQRWAKLEASIGHFVEGGYVNDDLIKQLQPPKFEHWELRSRKPRPSLRVFGRFAKPDVFVGTHVERRDALGGMWSTAFEHNKLVCEEHWRNAGLPAPFSDPPHFRYERYITSNAQRKIQVKP